MASEWYYAKGGKQFGPIGASELKGLATSGLLDASDLVWKEGMSDWSSAGSVPNLFVAKPTSANYSPAAPQSHNPYAAPKTIDGESLPHGEIEYASFGRRVGAALIDGAVSFLLGGALGLVLGIVAVVIKLDEGTLQTIARILGFVVGIFYWAGFESSASQATPGKTMLGMKVVDLHGHRISFLRGVGRHFAKYLSILTLGIGFLMVGLTQKRQGLHDMLAGTLILRVR